jgi:hypothetical protein
MRNLRPRSAETAQLSSGTCKMFWHWEPTGSWPGHSTAEAKGIPGVVPLVGERVAAGMPQYVRVRLDLKAGAGRGALDAACAGAP